MRIKKLAFLGLFYIETSRDVTRDSVIITRDSVSIKTSQSQRITRYQQ